MVRLSHLIRKFLKDQTCEEHHVKFMNEVIKRGDDEKMFHQFHVREPDRESLGLLWWKEGNLGAKPEEFHVKVHLFGAASSPGCANCGLNHVAKESERLFPLCSPFIMKDVYVDDGVTSTTAEDEVIQLANEAQELCATGGPRLQDTSAGSSHHRGLSHHFIISCFNITDQLFSVD